MPESLDFTIDLPVYPERVYRAWMDSGEMSRITGAPAVIEARAGGRFSALGGAVESQILALSPHDRILQSWQVSGSLSLPDTQVELLLSPTCTGTELRLRHTGLPAGQSQQVLHWWETTFLRPLRDYFDELVGEYTADMGDG